MQTVLAYFADVVDRSPEACAFRTSRAALTYADVAARVVDGMERLAGSAIRPRDRIVCLTQSAVPLAMMFLTAGMARVIPLAISPVFSKNFVASLCRQCGARAIFTTPEFLSLAGGVGLPVLLYAPDGGEKPTGVDQMLFGDSQRAPGDSVVAMRERSNAVRLDDAFLIQATSGSTGTPKLVLRNHFAFSRYATFVGQEVRHALPKGRGVRILAANSLTHAFACHMFTMAIRLGAEILVPDQIDISTSLKQVRSLDPDILPMTPRILHSFIRQQQADAEPPEARLFGPSARLVLSAGGRANAGYFRRLQGEGTEVVEFYGSSEASVVAVTPYGEWREGFAGVKVPDTTVKCSRRGELLVQNPGLMLGYYGDQDLTDLVMDEEGFHRTGDLGSIHEGGWIKILGRRRDVFNTPEGSNIYPERVEIMLESLDWVEQAFLIGDAQPYVTTHLVVRPGQVKRQEDIGHAQGMLESNRYESLYTMAGVALADLNQRLELVEQIVAFLLYTKPFEEDVYRVVTAGKVQRDRVRFVETHLPLVQRLYSDLDKDSLMLVPPRERRYRLRVASRQQVQAQTTQRVRPKKR